MLITDLDNLAVQISNGVSLAIPVSRSGPSMALTVALIKRGVKDLHLIACPTAGIQADLLIGAGCVGTVESAGITLDEHGQAGRFVAAVKNGEIRLKDTTCPAILSALQAGEKGVPFAPIRGLLGSDILKYREDYKVVDNPMCATRDPIVLLPAIVPDIAVFHAPLADHSGNIWIGSARELMTIAHTAKKTLVTVEKITDENLLDDPLRRPATIPEMYISGIAQAKHGAWPLGLEGCYDSDGPALAEYALAAKSSDRFQDYLSNHARKTAE